MTSNNIIDISDRLKKNTLFKKKNVLFPNCIQTTKSLAESEDLEMKLIERCDWDLFGSDSWGGFAYFGKTQNILNVQGDIDKYLKQCEYGQYYARWDFSNGYSALLLYEDYQDSPDNPLPSSKNVIRTEFGAWTNDVLLPEVLDTIEDWDICFVGKQKFDISKNNHLKLLEEFKKAVLVIFPKHEGYC